MAEWDAEYGELQIYIDNDYELYRQKHVIEENLKRKIKRGVYDPNRAPKLWSYMVDAGARKYCQEFGCSMRATFPKRAVRDPLATEYARDWESENATLLTNPRGRVNPMTKAQVWAEFKDMILPAIKAKEAERGDGVHGRPDGPMRREEWNNYTDMLCKDGMITMKQYETWTHPAGLETNPKCNPKHTRPEKPRKKKRTSTRKRPYSRGRLGGGKRKGNPKEKKISGVRSLVAKALK